MIRFPPLHQSQSEAGTLAHLQHHQPDGLTETSLLIRFSLSHFTSENLTLLLGYKFSLAQRRPPPTLSTQLKPHQSDSCVYRESPEQTLLHHG